jgi:hypothetical protein
MRDHPNTGGGVMAGLIDRDPTGAVPADANPSAAPRTATKVGVGAPAVEKTHKLRADVAAYVVIDAFLIGAWAAAGFGLLLAGLGPGRLGRAAAAGRVEPLLPAAAHRGGHRPRTARGGH